MSAYLIDTDWIVDVLHGNAHAMQTLLDLDVDLVMMSALRNRWFQREAAKTRTVIYDTSQISEVA